MDDFETEFDNLWRRAYGVAFVVLGDRSESEDIAQETLARAHVRWNKVSAYAGPWVVRVAGNLAIDRVRKWQRVRGVPAHDLPAADAQRVEIEVVHGATSKDFRIAASPRDACVLTVPTEQPKVWATSPSGRSTR